MYNYAIKNKVHSLFFSIYKEKSPEFNDFENRISRKFRHFLVFNVYKQTKF